MDGLLSKHGRSWFFQVDRPFYLLRTFQFSLLRVPYHLLKTLRQIIDRYNSQGFSSRKFRPINAIDLRIGNLKKCMNFSVRFERIGSQGIVPNRMGTFLGNIISSNAFKSNFLGFSAHESSAFSRNPRELNLSLTIYFVAFIGTTLSTFCIAGCAFIALQLSRLADLAPQEMKFNHCLQFGAMISATDPVTVLSIFKGKTLGFLSKK